MHDLPEGIIPIGYQALLQRYELESLPYFCSSYITMRGGKQILKDDHHEVNIYPKGYALKDPQDPLLQLEFAFKYEGLHLQTLKKILEKIPKKEILCYIAKHPLGRYARKLWYLYETLLDTKLSLTDSQKGPYIDLIDSKIYYAAIGNKSRRHLINNNLLGNFDFCPIVRKTKMLTQFEKKKLNEKASSLIKQYDEITLHRASYYLYTKETMSSWEIEHEKPTAKRLERFVSILKDTKRFQSLTKKALIQLQNEIVDPRFCDSDYRDYQNYIGEQTDFYRQKIHYIAPKPEDVASLMHGLLQCHEKMIESHIHPIIIAAVIAFGFVFIHPFEDGNGRIHRYLIHYILSETNFTPEDIIFPVSATILRDMKAYDTVLEEVSKPILSLLSYNLKPNGELIVDGKTDSFYRYIDFTHIAEFLFSRVEKTIETDFQQELSYIANYDKAKKEIQEVCDIPDRKIDLFIKCAMQNKGVLSVKKRESHFSMLTKTEIRSIEKIIQKNFFLTIP